MSALEVLEAGPYTSVQDRGRFGGQRYGLGPAGAMDPLALGVANALVGQPVGAAGVEIGPLPAKFRASGGDVRLALAGAGRGGAAQGRAVRLNETFVLAEGETLALRAASSGVFSYLAVEGGVLATPTFGSLSVHERSGMGAPYARALRPGDRLEVGAAGRWGAERTIDPPPRAAGPLRVVLGPQDDHFTPEAIDTFLAAEWRISMTSDRMGYRLEGPVLAHAKGHNIVSDGIALGSVQVPGNGQPLLLLADRGTTGGYPKIATILTADIGRLAQTPAGSALRFSAVSIAAGEAAARAFAAHLRSLPAQAREVGGGELSTEMLLAANLAGEATGAFD